MCLLITQPEGVKFDEKFLKGVYNKNKDGIGVMYAAGNVLYHAKQVPRNFNEYLAFYQQHIEGKACAWHSRLQTHGPIEIKNAHPFEVLNAERDGYVLWLMHNGILHTDNVEDPSQTDTALYIKNYLRPMLAKNPEFFMTEAFADIIGEHIGSGNKFVLLDAYGNQVAINERAFVDHNGAKLSNTYAWDTTGTEHDFRRSFGNYKGYTRGNVYAEDDDLWAGYGLPKNYGAPALVKPTTGDSSLDETETAAYDELKEMDDFHDELLDALSDAGYDLAMDVSYAEVRCYYEALGADAYTLIDMITTYGMSESDVIADLQSVQMEVLG